MRKVKTKRPSVHSPVREKIIQLATAQWGHSDKINSSLYALTSEGRVLQYIPAVNPEDAGWKRLNMRPAAPPTFNSNPHDMEDFL